MKQILSIFILLAVVSVANNAFAQSKGDKYYRSNTSTAKVLKKYDTATKTCSTEILDAKKHAKLLVVLTPQDPNSSNSYIVELTNNTIKGAKINNFYCISGADLATYFQPDTSGATVGALSVPFKIRFAPGESIAFTGGSTIGPYAGYRLGLGKDFDITFIGFASFSTIPINDATSSAPDLKLGLGLGGGTVATILNDFQIGLVVGTDLFSGASDWAYKYYPWMSLSVGYSFLSQGEDEEAAKRASKSIQQ